jgi:hypothetical protein
MRNNFYIMIIILTIFGCSPKVVNYETSEVNFISKETNGTITLKSLGYGNNLETAVANAQIKCFDVLLFKGIPGTELNVPLIENEIVAKQNNSNYFKKFYEQNYYKSFIMSSTESSNLIDLKTGKKIFVDIKINFNSLRKDLEQNHIIRKFGF